MRDRGQARNGRVLSRHECKYYLLEEQAAAIRAFIRPWVKTDDHSEKSPDHAYDVFSLYLDTPDLALYRMAADGVKNRFKLRIRTYGTVDAPVAFLEVKKRMTSVVTKRRAKVDTATVRSLLRREPSPHNGSDDLDAAHAEFVSLMRRTAAAPLMNVRYRREAYEAHGRDPVRITFDRTLAAAPATRTGDIGAWQPIDVEGVIFEVKFTNAFPTWVRALIDRFQLSQRSIPKYGLSVAQAIDRGELRGSRAAPAAVEPETARFRRET